MDFFSLKKYCLFILFVSFFNSVHAQWLGETEKIRRTPQSIRLYDETRSGSCLIYQPTVAVDQAQWSFHAHMKFNPSASNHVIFYPHIWAIQDHEVQHGISITMGREARNTDVVKVHYISPSSAPKLLWTSPASIILRADTLDTKLILTQRQNHWTLTLNNIEGEPFIFDPITKTPSHTGFRFKYTTTRYKAFFVRNFSVNYTAPIALDTLYFFHPDSLFIRWSLPVTELITEDKSLSVLQRSPHEFIIHKANWAYGDTERISLKLNGQTMAINPPYVSFDPIELTDIQTPNNHIILTFNRPIALSTPHQDRLRLRGIQSITHHNQTVRIAPPDSWLGTQVNLPLDSLVFYIPSADFNREYWRHADTSLFIAYSPSPDDIRINEIMYDPRKGQPEAIELYNASAYSIRLSDLWLVDYTSSGRIKQSLPIQTDELFPPMSYLTISDEPDAYTHTIVSSSLGTLSNSQDQIVLRYQNLYTLDSVGYNQSWHHPDIGSSSRGISLQWNHHKQRWTSTDTTTKHTLGLANTAFYIPTYQPSSPWYALTDSSTVKIRWTDRDFNLGVNPPHRIRQDTDTVTVQLNTPLIADESYLLQLDVLYEGVPKDMLTLWLELPEFTSPKIERITLKKDTIELDFATSFILTNDALQQIQLQNPHLRTLSLGRSGSQVFITYSHALHNGQLVTLRLKDLFYSPPLFDFPLSYADPIDTQMIAPYLPKINDLRINEILYEPNDMQEEAIEIKNLSLYYIDTRSILWVRYDKHRRITSTKPLTQTVSHIAPQGVKAFTRYTPFIDSNAVHSTSLGTLKNDGDLVVIKNSQLQTLDSLQYSPDWHHAFLKNNTKGISLERIDPQAPSTQSSNWISANTHHLHSLGRENFASPTKESEQVLSLSSSVFAPNREGRLDFLAITINLSKPERVNLYIVNMNGQIIQRLIDNQLINGTTTALWHGTNENQTTMNPGFYVVFFERIELSKVERKLVTLSY